MPKNTALPKEVGLKSFYMTRDADESGVSGTGKVLEGCVFKDGTTVIRWCVEGKPSSTAIYPTFEDFNFIHVTSHPTNGTKFYWNDSLTQAHQDTEQRITELNRQHAMEMAALESTIEIKAVVLAADKLDKKVEQAVKGERKRIKEELEKRVDWNGVDKDGVGWVNTHELGYIFHSEIRRDRMTPEEIKEALELSKQLAPSEQRETK